MKKLDPNAKPLFYLTGVIAWLFSTALIFIPIFIPLMVEGFMDEGLVLFLFFLALTWSFFIPLPFAHWSYENYKYELQKEGIYIERGIIWKRYISIPYERVQNVDVIRGPLARMFSLSDLQIQTAGAGVVIGEGKIPGITVEEANKLREEILSKVSGKKPGF